MADPNDMNRLYDLMKSGFDGVHSRLDSLDGRARSVENKVAVLEDRGVRTSDKTARWTGGIALGAGILVEIGKRLFGGAHQP